MSLGLNRVMNLFKQQQKEKGFMLMSSRKSVEKVYSQGDFDLGCSDLAYEIGFIYKEECIAYCCNHEAKKYIINDSLEVIDHAGCITEYEDLYSDTDAHYDWVSCSHIKIWHEVEDESK